MLPKKDKDLHFPKFANESTMSNAEICCACNGCCKYVTVIMHEPKTAEDLDQFKWYLLHNNVQIFIDNEGEWNLLFITDCSQLGPNGQCMVYDSRPELCREYEVDTCSRIDKDHQVLFRTPEDMENYLKVVNNAKK